MESLHDFMPHGYCISWDVTLLTLHVISDVFIALAYFSIPIGIVYFVNKTRESRFKPVYYLFAAFITACGLTHLMGVITLWYPVYYLSGFMKLVTAVVSMATAIYFIPKLPKMVSLPDLDELIGLNQSLREENLTRQSTEEKLENSRHLLAESNKMLSTLLDAIPLRVFWKDKESVFLGANRLFLNDCGMKDMSELVGLTDLDMPWGARYGQKFRKDDRDVMTNGVEMLQVEEELVTSEGTHMWLNTYKVPLKNDNDEVIGILSTFEDITQSKVAAMELEMAKEAAEQANILKSQFLANISHELRTPLNAVIGAYDLITKTKLDKQQQNLIDISKRSAESLLGLLSDILDLSKIESGKLSIVPIEENLVEILVEVAKEMAGRAEESHLELLCPAHHLQPLNIKIDRTRLKQILNNLITNAIKFTNEGVITVDVALSDTGRGTTRLRFSVSDTGIGISSKQQSVLFKRFSQVDGSSTRSRSGAGLGLAISKQLIELMGGKIGVTSTEGVGSTFWFEIEVESALPDKTMLLQTPKLANLNIAVLAELPAYTQYFEDVLTEWNVNHSVLNSTTALHTLLQDKELTQPNVLIIDMAFFLKTDLSFFTDHSVKGIHFVILSSQIELAAPPAKTADYDCSLLAKPIVESELFDLLLPLTGSQESPQSVTFDPQSGKYQARILLVEDNEVNVIVAKGLIHLYGPQVDAALNGKEALEMLRKHHYDLVFMDCQMPVMDGYECTRQIRDPDSAVLNHQVPIIAITANAMRGDRELCLDAGMNDYIAKPIEANKIREILENWLGQQSSPQHEDWKNHLEQVEKQKLFNKDKFKDRMMGDGALIRQVITHFIVDIQAQIEILESLVNSGDLDEVSRRTIRIKNAAENVEADQLVTHAAFITDLLKQGAEQSAIKQYLILLENCFNDLKKTLQSELL